MKKSTALTVPKKNGGAVALPYNFNPEAAKEKMKQRGVSERKFPGDPYYFKKGKFYTGSWKKESRAKVEPGSKLVFNPAYAVETWQSFADGRPQFSKVVFVADADASLPSRDEMGQTDRTLWKTDNKGKPMDPWSRLLVIPVRSKGGAEINHFVASSTSGRIALERLINDWLDQYDEHVGELPLVSLNVEERENKDKEIYDAPVFKIVGWVKANKEDTPGADGFVTESAAEDEAEVEDDEDDNEKPAKNSKRRSRDVEEDDEDEPSNRRKSSAASRKSSGDDEDEDDDDGQDEKAVTARNKRRLKSRNEDDDEDDDDKPRVSRKRRMQVEDDD